jgi:hypothetical protein
MLRSLDIHAFSGKSLEFSSFFWAREETFGAHVPLCTWLKMCLCLCYSSPLGGSFITLHILCSDSSQICSHLDGHSSEPVCPKFPVFVCLLAHHCFSHTCTCRFPVPVRLCRWWLFTCTNKIRSCNSSYLSICIQNLVTQNKLLCVQSGAI